MASSIAGLDDLIRTCDQFLAGQEVDKVVERGALNIKNDWRRRWGGLTHAPALPYAVTYDVTREPGGVICGEIGPDKTKRQGALGNIIEFGSPTSAPHPGGAPALDTEEPRFLAQVEQAVVRQLNG